MKFQGQASYIRLNSPFKGMNATDSNTTESARYLQNILIGDNNNCVLRNGTRLVAQMNFDDNMIPRSIIANMAYLNASGKAEKITYQNYLKPLPNITVDRIKVEEGAESNYSKITVYLSVITLEQKNYLARIIFDGLYIYVKQAENSDGADISNVTVNIANNYISFNIAFPKSFFAISGGVNQFQLFIERAALYKMPDNLLLKDDLDPNSIVSYLNYQGELLIANGVDPIMTYNAGGISVLKGNASVPVQGNIGINGNQIIFDSLAIVRDELRTYLVLNSEITLINNNGVRSNLKINNISIINGQQAHLIKLIITLNNAPPVGTKTVLYKKDLPPFNFITVVNGRLWALAEGRSFKNQFRPADKSMKVYYAYERNSTDGWFNPDNYIDFIDLNSYSLVPDNLEAIVAFQGKTVFLGRETMQVWTGEDPPATNEEGKIDLGDFRWEMSYPIGIWQKSLFQEMPNDIIFLSKYGIVSVSSINQYQQLSVAYNFSRPINGQLTHQLALIANDRDYREMRSFIYPFGRFLGFKLKNNCFIYQLNTGGSWTIFTDSFADSKSFYYDSVSQDLIIGMDNGILLAYADKAGTANYTDWQKDNILWRVNYHWLYPESTWNNEFVHLACRTLKPMTVNIQIYIDYNEATYIAQEIEIEQGGSMLDVANFGEAGFSYVKNRFPGEVLRFQADSMMIELDGLSNDRFIFDRLFLSGGVDNAA